MRQLRRSMRTLSVGVAASLVLVACGGDEATPPTTDDTPQASEPADTGGETEAMTDEPTDDGTAMADGGGPASAASSLRATLTAGLQEHVYLAGITVYQGVVNGLESDAFTAAAAALDGNSKALAAAIGSVYGQEAVDAFLPLWRKHIGFFVDYTAAKASGDEAAAQAAREGLDQYRADFAAFISSANPNLPAEAVAQELVPHVQTLFTAIDAVLGNGQDPFMALRDASNVMPGTAKTLATGIVAQFPEMFPGDPAGPGADLRALLTEQLQEHVYLAGIAVVVGVGNGLESDQFKAAAAALDTNSVALSESIGSVYGQEAADAFLPLWRKHIGFFVDYTAARASGDEAAAQAAREGLDQYRADFAAFISSANPNLPAEAVAEELVPHVQTLFAAIDAVLGNGQDPFAALAEAAAVMPGTAATLAGGIAAQFPDKFGG